MMSIYTIVYVIFIWPVYLFFLYCYSNRFPAATTCLRTSVVSDALVHITMSITEKDVVNDEKEMKR